MGFKQDKDKGAAGGDGGERRSFQRKRGCRFCADSDLRIDYKDRLILSPFLTERFKIIPRRITGNCAAHQRELTLAIKRARHIATVPYTSAQI